MKRFRTIRQAVSEIREADPKTAISETNVRILLRNGIIPSRKAGRKYVVCVEDILRYYGNEG